MAGRYLVLNVTLLTPHKNSTIRSTRSQRVECRLVCTLIVELRTCLLLGPPDCNGLPINNSAHSRQWIIHVAYKNRFCGANNHASWFKTNIQTVSAEVALLSRVVFRINEDRVVWTSCDTCLTPYTDRLIKIHNTVSPPKHRRCWTSFYAGRVIALVTPRNLK